MFRLWINLTRCALGQDALQRAAVHVEAARRLGNVVAAESVYGMDGLRMNASRSLRICMRLGFFVRRGEQRREDILEFGGLCELAEGAGLPRGDRGGDGAVA